MIVNIKKINEGKIPQFMHDDDACADCYANEDVDIEPNSRKLVSLGFALGLPKYTEAIIRPRSGLSKKGIDIAIGTVDSNYTGELKACVINNSKDIFHCEKGDRICQIAVREIEHIFFDEVEKLEETDRGSNGFGSTGV